MITCHLRGGLGNQLFQIFTTISYAIEYKLQFKFTNQETLGGNGCIKRFTYWKTFLKSLKHCLFTIMPNNMIQIHENGFQYNQLSIPIVDSSNQNIILVGYFQSYKYFEKHYETICRLIKLNEQRDKYSNESNKNAISMHFRLGDYKKLGHLYPIMNVEYYKNALHYILSQEKTNTLAASALASAAISTRKILYFCEQEDINDVLKTIQQLQIEFPNCIFEKADSNNSMSDWEQLLLMSCCQDNIIANSSFSWFGAYFNTNPNKIVCYPKNWFCGQGSHNVTDDLCPDSWKCF